MGVVQDLAAGAAVALVVEGSNYDVRVKRPKRSRILHQVTEPAEIDALTTLLAVSDEVTDYASMTMPTFTLAFMTGGSVLAQFGYFDGWLRSESWSGGDRVLINRARVAAWIATSVDTPR